MEWTLKAEAIRGFNAKMNAEAARLTRWFGERGRKTSILKGQPNARLYPHPDERQPGDIDIWVEGGRDSVVKLLGDEGVLDTKDTVSYHHAHLKKKAIQLRISAFFFCNGKVGSLLYVRPPHSERHFSLINYGGCNGIYYAACSLQLLLK